MWSVGVVFSSLAGVLLLFTDFSLAMAPLPKIYTVYTVATAIPSWIYQFPENNLDHGYHLDG